MSVCNTDALAQPKIPCACVGVSLFGVSQQLGSAQAAKHSQRVSLNERRTFLDLFREKDAPFTSQRKGCASIYFNKTCVFSAVPFFSRLARRRLAKSFTIRRRRNSRARGNTTRARYATQHCAQSFLCNNCPTPPLSKGGLQVGAKKFQNIKNLCWYRNSKHERSACRLCEEPVGTSALSL